jgi:hypothetical protein
MTANPKFKVYMKHSRPMSGYDEEIPGTKKSTVDKQIISSTLWTDIKKFKELT